MMGTEAACAGCRKGEGVNLLKLQSSSLCREHAEVYPEYSVSVGFVERLLLPSKT